MGQLTLFVISYNEGGYKPTLSINRKFSSSLNRERLGREDAMKL